MKFSDNAGEFELFLFAEILVNNRDKILESESFVLTLFKDKPVGDQSQSRVNIKKISSLSDLISKPYPKITIEVNDNLNLNELKKILANRGSAQNINLIVNNQNKKIHYVLQNPRKLDYNLIKLIKTKEYVKKISV